MASSTAPPNLSPESARESVRSELHDPVVATERIAAELRQLIESSQVPPDELATLISNTFTSGRMLPGSAEVLWGQSQEEVALRLVYSSSGRFAIVTEEALTDADASTLIDRINVLERGGEPAVWRTVLFAAVPVDGYWRYEDRWQIRPVPDDAPRPEFLMAPHPFIL